MLPIWVTYFSIINSISSSYFYILETIKGKTKPNKVSWFVWFLAPFVGSLIVFFEGGGYSALPIFISSVTSFSIFVASFLNKNAYWKLERLDKICLVLSLVSIFFWLYLKHGELATFFAVVADLIAFLPTYLKSWKDPHSENLAPYFSGSVNAILALSTLKIFNFTTYGFALYFLLGCVLEIGIVLYRRKIC